MRLQRLLPACTILAAFVLPLPAQEPRPAWIRASILSGPEGIHLGLAWRFAPGDGPGRESPQFDDTHWRAVRPLMTPADVPPDWPGVGWFRRHLLIDPALQKRSLALRFAGPGVADVYLDGRLVLSSGRSTPQPEIPSERRDASAVQFDGHRHVLAVRYAYPKDGPRIADGIGYRLTLANAAPAPRAAGQRAWIVGLQGAVIALPILLALLQLALFAFDLRARENLFYAAAMVAVAVILFHDLSDTFLVSEAQQELVNRVERGAKAVALLFGVLTYYALRTDPYPRTWRVFVAAGVALFVASYLALNVAQYGWIIYFFAAVVEIIRLEYSGRTVRREAAGFLLASGAVFGVAIVLQILIMYGVFESVAGVREVYLFGIIAAAAGTSLHLARRMGQSRLIEAESERKTLELTRARELQLSMLPRELPRVPGLDIAAATKTATEVGGDYYDVRTVGDGSLLFAFGDATGHGLASGIVVTAAKALFNSLPTGSPPRELLATCDRALRAMQLPTLRMCLALARVSPFEATVASAAMPPVLIHRNATDGIEELGAGGLPLGSRLPARYEDRRATLGAGDTLLFASDGFAELLDPEGRTLGYDGVAEAFLDATDAASAHEVVERLAAAASTFRGRRPQDDDITFVVVRVTATAV